MGGRRTGRRGVAHEGRPGLPVPDSGMFPGGVRSHVRDLARVLLPSAGTRGVGARARCRAEDRGGGVRPPRSAVRSPSRTTVRSLGSPSDHA